MKLTDFDECLSWVFFSIQKDFTPLIAYLPPIKNERNQKFHQTLMRCQFSAANFEICDTFMP